MPETIESFVAKLQAEGVEAGKQKADKLKTQAEAEKQQVLQEAREQAETIIADAKAEAERIVHRGKTDLQIAARDTALKLRERLSKGLSALAAQASREKLDDPDFLGRVLHELVLMYAKSECEHKRAIRINVPDTIRDQLVDWALRELGQESVGGDHTAIDLKGTLREAGFEYEIADGGNVEVTLDAVVQNLTEIVKPSLGELLREAMSDGDATAHVGQQDERNANGGD
ncbi:MAG: hypothetical protein KGY99_00500 [Phycisphaerae bacterium]|nr:hypothetical protein [Phycisphaerae bacterium]